MLKNTALRTVLFAILYLAINLALSWLFNTDIDIKLYLASCLIGSVIYYLLDPRLKPEEVVVEKEVVKEVPVIKEVIKEVPVPVPAEETPKATTKRTYNKAKKATAKTTKPKATKTTKAKKEEAPVETKPEETAVDESDPFIYEPTVPTAADLDEKKVDSLTSSPY